MYFCSIIGVTGDEGGKIDNFHPSTSEEFTQFAKLLQEKISTYEVRCGIFHTLSETNKNRLLIHNLYYSNFYVICEIYCFDRHLFCFMGDHSRLLASKIYGLLNLQFMFTNCTPWLFSKAKVKLILITVHYY